MHSILSATKLQRRRNRILLWEHALVADIISMFPWSVAITFLSTSIALIQWVTVSQNYPVELRIELYKVLSKVPWISRNVPVLPYYLLMKGQFYLIGCVKLFHMIFPTGMHAGFCREEYLKAVPPGYWDPPILSDFQEKEWQTERPEYFSINVGSLTVHRYEYHSGSTPVEGFSELSATLALNM